MPRCDPPHAPKHPRFARSLVFRGRLLAMNPGGFEEIISQLLAGMGFEMVEGTG